jgi:hypothetical protein
MDFLTALYIAIFFFIMGAAIVGLIWYLRRVAQHIRKGSRESMPADPDLSEIARLMRHLQTQELVVEMDGRAFSTYDELSPAQQRRLSFTSNVLSKWIGVTTSGSQKEIDDSLSALDTAPEMGLPGDTKLFESQESNTPPFFGDPLNEVRPVSTSLPDMVDNFLNPTPPSTPTYKSIAEQINELLQARLIGTAFNSRGITLRDAPDRGVLVTLDGKQYNSVMDVPDEEVRNIIRDAVVEWESTK